MASAPVTAPSLGLEENKDVIDIKSQSDLKDNGDS
jgi:hypothetical protein